MRMTGLKSTKDSMQYAMWALSCYQNFNNKKSMYYLFNNEKDSEDHLFYIYCESTSTLYDIIKIKIRKLKHQLF